MFKRVFKTKADTVTVRIENKSVSVPEGDSVAAAIFSAGYGHTRQSPVSDSLRAPYCMMGVCFECLVEIDGVPNQQACMTPVREGMQIRLQLGARRIAE